MSIKENFSYQEYITKARKLDNVSKINNLKKISLSFYSNFTSELLDAFLKLNFCEIGYLVDINYFSYGKIEENIFNNSKNQSDIVFFTSERKIFFLIFMIC